MIRFKLFNQLAALSALLLCFSLNSAADEIQDANKLFKRGQPAQALSKVDTILATQPRDAQARFLKSLILSEQGLTDEAVRMLTALTEDYPELPEPYNNLAVLYAGQGQYEKAKIVLEKALRTHPSYATAHENMGNIYAKMASQAYDRALQLDRSKSSPTTKLSTIKDMHTPVAKATITKTQLASVSVSPAPVAATVAATPASPAATVPAATAASPVLTNAEPATPKPAAVKSVVAEAANTGANDEVLKALNESVQVGTTPVIITNQMEWSDDADKADQAELNKAIEQWRNDWASINTDSYLKHYASDFATGNFKLETWSAQKRLVNSENPGSRSACQTSVFSLTPINPIWWSSILSSTMPATTWPTA